MKISVDPFAGFCPGVKRTISVAGQTLDFRDSVNSFGELVHCPEELDRLAEQGLTVIGLEDIKNISDSVIIIRAHGVTPQVQHQLEISNNVIIDSTCGIVRRLQQKVKSASIQMQQVDGQVVIFGKRKHPEVNGLLGYSNCKTIVIENATEFKELDISKPMSIFAQTTSNVEDFEAFITNLFDLLNENEINSKNILVYNTICGSIKSRVPNLKLFAKGHDVIVFVTGTQSSNGAYMSSIVRQENCNTYNIASENELQANWFINAQSVGITGAASTPVWLLNKVAERVSKIVSTCS